MHFYMFYSIHVIAEYNLFQIVSSLFRINLQSDNYGIASGNNWENNPLKMPQYVPTLGPISLNQIVKFACTDVFILI